MNPLRLKLGLALGRLGNRIADGHPQDPEHWWGTFYIRPATAPDRLNSIRDMIAEGQIKPGDYFHVEVV